MFGSHKVGQQLSGREAASRAVQRRCPDVLEPGLGPLLGKQALHMLGSEAYVLGQAGMLFSCHERPEKWSQE